MPAQPINASTVAVRMIEPDFCATICHPTYLQHRKVPFNTDRKSTRLNSSHSQISYAVFCLKKKKKTADSDGREAARTAFTGTARGSPLRRRQTRRGTRADGDARPTRVLEISLRPAATRGVL